MFGLVPLYGIPTKETTKEVMVDAKLRADNEVPTSIGHEIVGVTVMGDINDSHVSVEVEVVFPHIEDESELPPRYELFPSAEVVSALVVTAIDK